jgi:hypothetical protein
VTIFDLLLLSHFLQSSLAARRMRPDPVRPNRFPINRAVLFNRAVSME